MVRWIEQLEASCGNNAMQTRARARATHRAGVNSVEYFLRNYVVVELYPGKIVAYVIP